MERYLSSKDAASAHIVPGNLTNLKGLGRISDEFELVVVGTGTEYLSLYVKSGIIHSGDLIAKVLGRYTDKKNKGVSTFKIDNHLYIELALHYDKYPKLLGQYAEFGVRDYNCEMVFIEEEGLFLRALKDIKPKSQICLKTYDTLRAQIEHSTASESAFVSEDQYFEFFYPHTKKWLNYILASDQITDKNLFDVLKLLDAPISPNMRSDKQLHGRSGACLVLNDKPYLSLTTAAGIIGNFMSVFSVVDNDKEGNQLLDAILKTNGPSGSRKILSSYPSIAVIGDDIVPPKKIDVILVTNNDTSLILEDFIDQKIIPIYWERFKPGGCIIFVEPIDYPEVFVEIPIIKGSFVLEAIHHTGACLYRHMVNTYHLQNNLAFDIEDNRGIRNSYLAMAALLDKRSGGRREQCVWNRGHLPSEDVFPAELICAGALCSVSKLKPNTTCVILNTRKSALFMAMYIHNITAGSSCKIIVVSSGTLPDSWARAALARMDYMRLNLDTAPRVEFVIDTSLFSLYTTPTSLNENDMMFKLLDAEPSDAVIVAIEANTIENIERMVTILKRKFGRKWSICGLSGNLMRDMDSEDLLVTRKYLSSKSNHFMISLEDFSSVSDSQSTPWSFYTIHPAAEKNITFIGDTMKDFMNPENVRTLSSLKKKGRDNEESEKVLVAPGTRGIVTRDPYTTQMIETQTTQEKHDTPMKIKSARKRKPSDQEIIIIDDDEGDEGRTTDLSRLVKKVVVHKPETLSAETVVVPTKPRRKLVKPMKVNVENTPRLAEPPSGQDSVTSTVLFQSDIQVMYDFVTKEKEFFMSRADKAEFLRKRNNVAGEYFESSKVLGELLSVYEHDYGYSELMDNTGEVNFFKDVSVIDMDIVKRGLENNLVWLVEDDAELETPQHIDEYLVIPLFRLKNKKTIFLYVFNSDIEEYDRVEIAPQKYKKFDRVATRLEKTLATLENTFQYRPTSIIQSFWRFANLKGASSFKIIDEEEEEKEADRNALLSNKKFSEDMQKMSVEQSARIITLFVNAEAYIRNLVNAIADTSATLNKTSLFSNNLMQILHGWFMRQPELGIESFQKVMIDGQKLFKKSFYNSWKLIGLCRKECESIELDLTYIYGEKTRSKISENGRAVVAALSVPFVWGLACFVDRRAAEQFCGVDRLYKRLKMRNLHLSRATENDVVGKAQQKLNTITVQKMAAFLQPPEGFIDALRSFNGMTGAMLAENGSVFKLLQSIEVYLPFDIIRVLSETGEARYPVLFEFRDLYAPSYENLSAQARIERIQDLVSKIILFALGNILSYIHDAGMLMKHQKEIVEFLTNVYEVVMVLGDNARYVPVSTHRNIASYETDKKLKTLTSSSLQVIAKRIVAARTGIEDIEKNLEDEMMAEQNKVVRAKIPKPKKQKPVNEEFDIGESDEDSENEGEEEESDAENEDFILDYIPDENNEISTLSLRYKMRVQNLINTQVNSTIDPFDEKRAKWEKFPFDLQPYEIFSTESYSNIKGGVKIAAQETYFEDITSYFFSVLQRIESAGVSYVDWYSYVNDIAQHIKPEQEEERAWQSIMVLGAEANKAEWDSVDFFTGFVKVLNGLGKYTNLVPRFKSFLKKFQMPNYYYNLNNEGEISSRFLTAEESEILVDIGEMFFELILFMAIQNGNSEKDIDGLKEAWTEHVRHMENTEGADAYKEALGDVDYSIASQLKDKLIEEMNDFNVYVNDFEKAVTDVIDKDFKDSGVGYVAGLESLVEMTVEAHRKSWFDNYIVLVNVMVYEIAKKIVARQTAIKAKYLAMLGADRSEMFFRAVKRGIVKFKHAFIKKTSKQTSQLSTAEHIKRLILLKLHASTVTMSDMLNNFMVSQFRELVSELIRGINNSFACFVSEDDISEENLEKPIYMDPRFVTGTSKIDIHDILSVSLTSNGIDVRMSSVGVVFTNEENISPIMLYQQYAILYSKIMRVYDQLVNIDDVLPRNTDFFGTWETEMEILAVVELKNFIDNLRVEDQPKLIQNIIVWFQSILRSESIKSGTIAGIQEELEANTKITQAYELVSFISSAAPLYQQVQNEIGQTTYDMDIKKLIIMFGQLYQIFATIVSSPECVENTVKSICLLKNTPDVRANTMVEYAVAEKLFYTCRMRFLAIMVKKYLRLPSVFEKNVLYKVCEAFNNGGIFSTRNQRAVTSFTPFISRDPYVTRIMSETNIVPGMRTRVLGQLIREDLPNNTTTTRVAKLYAYQLFAANIAANLIQWVAHVWVTLYNIGYVYENSTEEMKPLLLADLSEDLMRCLKEIYTYSLNYRNIYDSILHRKDIREEKAKKKRSYPRILYAALVDERDTIYSNMSNNLVLDVISNIFIELGFPIQVAEEFVGTDNLLDTEQFLPNSGNSIMNALGVIHQQEEEYLLKTTLLTNTTPEDGSSLNIQTLLNRIETSMRFSAMDLKVRTMGAEIYKNEKPVLWVRRSNYVEIYAVEYY